MKSFLPLLGLFVSTSVVAAAEEPAMRVGLSKARIYEGESVLYQVAIDNVEDPPTPKLEGFDDFEVESRGAESRNSQQINIVNGQMTKVVRYSRVFNYVLTPKRAGELTIPVPTADVNGRLLQGKSLTLEVIAPEDQDSAFLEIQIDKTSVYPMQPFTVTLDIAVKGLPEPHDDEDPVAVLASVSRSSGSPFSMLDDEGIKPLLSVPWATDDELPSGLESDRRLERWLAQFTNRRSAGFGINNYRLNTSSMSMFDRQPTGFLPKAERTRRKDKSGKSAGYWEYAFGRTFVAKQVGEYAFGPVTLDGSFIVRVNTRGGGELERVYAVGKPVTVHVKDVPLEGRPASYSGAVGEFEFRSQLAPTKAKVGDPMTLTLTLEGEGTLDAVATPDLGQLPEVADRFKIYEATEESEPKLRRFTYSLRPLKADIGSFPPIAMSYFDVEKGKYVTLTTKQIPIQVSRAEQLSERDIAVASVTPSNGNEIETQEGGIFANDSAVWSLRNDSVDPVRWFSGLGTMAGAYLIIVLVAQKLQRLFGDPDLLRRRSAAARARRRLRCARHTEDDARLEADRLQAAVVGLVADVTGTEEAGLTTGEVRQRLADLEVDEGLVERLAVWCEACDAARYGASADALHGLEDEAGALLDELIKVFKRRRVLR